MNKQSIPLGRILGISVGLDYSWFIVFGLLTWSLAISYYPHEFKDWATGLYWLMGAITAIMLFVSVLLHELGHSIVALRYKIPVNKITLFIFGGVAEITKEPPSAGAEFWIAIAGPAVSFSLAIIFYLMEPLFSAVAPIFALAKYLALINGMLALFNLIPGFPLDGGRVFRAIVWGITRDLRRSTIIAANVGRFIAFLFIFFGVLQMFGGNLVGGIWIAFIGWFLESAAIAQVQLQAVQGILAGHKVYEAMNPKCPLLPPEATLAELVDRYVLGTGQRCFVVQNNDRIEGMLTLHQIRKIPKDAWPETTISQAMIPLADVKVTRPDVELAEALKEMDRDGVNQLLVISNGELLGMLSREDVIDYMRRLEAFAIPK